MLKSKFKVSSFLLTITLLCASIYLVFSYDLVKAEALDVGRYYEMAIENAHVYNNIVFFIKDQIDANVDFIYQTFLYIAAEIGLPFQIITLCFFIVYYLASYLIVQTYCCPKSKMLCIIVYALLFSPIIWILTISRNVAALGLFFIGMLYYLKHKPVSSFFWILLSIFTHVSMMIYAVVFLVSIYITKSKINLMQRRVLLLILVIVGYVAPSLIIDYLSPYISSLNMRYSNYADMAIISPIKATNLSWFGDKLIILFSWLVSIFCSYYDSRNDALFWTLYLSTCLLSMFIWSNVMMTNRLMMFMTPLVGISLCYVYKAKKGLVTIISILGIMLAMGSLYAYRGMF